jgi:hypothetical protein
MARTPAKGPTKVRFIGTPDQFVTGYPQGELVIGDRDAPSEGQITPQTARDLLASGLYAADGSAIPESEAAATSAEGGPA